MAASNGTNRYRKVSLKNVMVFQQTVKRIIEKLNIRAAEDPLANAMEKPATL